MRFIFFLPLSLSVLILSGQQDQTLHYDLDNFLDPADAFPYGVASGDPTSNSVVLWTSVNHRSPQSATIGWQIATDSSMYNVINFGRTQATIENGFTIKVEVDQLAAGTYYYQFSYGQQRSPIGRTKTAPIGSDTLRLAVVSCADYQTGHFNAYRHIASRHDLDAVVHLGDYIYETSDRKWGPRKQRNRMYRKHIPGHLLVTLQDYRTRYAQYRLDRHLQEAHRLHPFISAWDDHEFSNNANAEDVSARGLARRNAARQAYFEWMPVRKHPDKKLYRQFSFGSLADLWMLDTRQEGRSAQAENEDDPSWQSPERSMLGSAQEQWLLDGMKKSAARWKVIGNQVIFSRLHDSRVFSRVPAIKMDRWDGYPVAQQRLLSFFDRQDLNNIVVLTGDVHTSWALELSSNPFSTNPVVRGAEFITPSISSFNMNDILPRPIAWEAERRFKKKKHNPHLKYLDLVRHGYLTLTLTADAARAHWLFFNPRRSTAKVQQQRSRAYLPKVARVIR